MMEGPRKTHIKKKKIKKIIKLRKKLELSTKTCSVKVAIDAPLQINISNIEY